MNPSQSTVANGNLRIKAEINNDGTRWMKTGRVQSRAQISFPMYTECRMKASSISGYNTFWLNNGNAQNRNEIDVCENNAAPTNRNTKHGLAGLPITLQSNIHHAVNNVNLTSPSYFKTTDLPANNPNKGKKFDEAYFRIGLYWENNRKCHWYLDGVYAGTSVAKRDFTRNLAIIFDLWTTRWDGFATRESLRDNSKNTMYVDWVHTFKLVNGQAPVVTTPVTPPVVTPTPNPNPTPNPTPNPSPNQKPALSFEKIKNGAQLNTGSNVAVEVKATDADGIKNVRLYLNNNLVRQENISPYLWGANDNALKNLKAGNYNLKAIATDSKGLSNEIQISFTVNGGSTPTPTVPVVTPTPDGTPTNGSQVIANGLYNIKGPFKNEALLLRKLENYNTKMINDGNYTDQQWLIKHLGGNVYTIQNSRNNRYLEVPNGACANAANVATWVGAAQNHQKWKIEKNGQYYSLKPMHCLQQALDRVGGASKANVITWTFNGTNNNQKWVFSQTSRGLKQLADSKSILYPNPVKSGNSITITNVEINTVIGVFNTLGQLQVEAIATESNTEIPLSGLASGMYFVKIGDQISEKLIIK